MRFLLYGNLTPAVAAAITRHGHVAADLAMADLPTDIPVGELPAQLHRKQLDVVTNNDSLLAAAEAFSGKFDRCIVYLQLSGGEVEQDDAIDRLFARYKRLSPKRIYTVTETRVKVKQLPGLKSRTSRQAAKGPPEQD